MRPARVRLLQLLVLTAVPAAVEAALLRAIGFRTAVSLAPQASAVWPYNTLHDLRWLLVYHNSWASFVGELLLALVLRALYCALLITVAWPAELPRPTFPRLAARNLAFSAAIAVIVAPWAGMAVIASEVSLSWLLLLELLPMLVLSPLVQRGGIAPDWWRGLPPPQLVGWSVLSFLAPMVGGALPSSVHSWWSVPLAAVGGVINGLLWQRIVRTAVRHEPVRWRWLPTAPLAFVVLLVLLSTIDLEPTMGRAEPVRQPLDLLAERGEVSHTVIYLSGYDSSYSGRVSKARPIVVRYSYRGTDGSGFPRPYSPRDTHQSVMASAELLATQVSRLHALTGRPVALVGESEGTLIIRYYLRNLRHPAVDTAVLASPLVRAGRIYYPPPGASKGWGIATGWLLRGVFALKGRASSVPDNADEPFLRSLLDTAPLYRNELLCPVPGVRLMAFVPVSETLAIPPGNYAQIPLVQVPAVHGMLIDNEAVVDRLMQFLEEKDGFGTTAVVPARSAEYLAARGAAGAWLAPALALRLNPVWHRQGVGDAAFKRAACPR